MCTLANDLELQMLTHRLSPELQCSADSVFSCVNVARCLPISTHSFERQLTKETSVTVEEMVIKSETASIRYLNLTISDCLFIALNDDFVYTLDWLSAIIR
jgi:hypothetical protein